VALVLVLVLVLVLGVFRLAAIVIHLLVQTQNTHLCFALFRFTELLEDEKTARQRSIKEKEARAFEFQKDTDLMEEDASREIDGLKKHYESQLIAEREATLRLKGENILMKNKHESLLQDIADQKEEIKTLVKRETERYAQIERLDKEIVSHSKEIEERDKTVRVNPSQPC